MYDAVADDYCYPGTTVLKNKLNLTDVDELAAFEATVRFRLLENVIAVSSCLRRSRACCKTCQPVVLFSES
jgi:hypothetical protein